MNCKPSSTAQIRTLVLEEAVRQKIVRAQVQATLEELQAEPSQTLHRLRLADPLNIASKRRTPAQLAKLLLQGLCGWRDRKGES